MKDKFNAEFYTAIETIKSKVMASDLTYNNTEWLALAFITKEINRVLFGRVRELKRGCSGQCVASAVQIIRNFINANHMEEPKAGKAEVKRVVVEQPKLKDLRKQYPHIKAISVESFLNKLQDGHSTVSPQ